MNTENLIRMLLVEDDEDDYLILSDYLSDTPLNIEITWARNFEQFKQAIAESDFDLVLTDYLLGSTSGIDVLKRVKEKNALMPVMILTGKGNTHIDMEAMKLGAADYLIKGNFDAASLDRSIRYTLERVNSSKLQRENENYQNTLDKIVSTDRIARMIAHEVKNPLTNIVLCTEQLREAAEGNDEIATYVEIILRNSKRIDQLIMNFLDSTRFGDINLKTADLVQVIGDTLGLAMDRIKLRAIELKENYPSPSVNLRVDAEKIKLAFLNIIINAVEAMEDNKGEIEVKITSDEHYIKVHFADNGPGIPQDIKAKLFDPFFTSKPKGSGLGLASAQNIVLGHKGKIEVNSEPGRGTEFVISLPHAG